MAVEAGKGNPAPLHSGQGAEAILEGAFPIGALFIFIVIGMAEFRINGTDAKKYGSQGQQRTIALSLKLAEIRIAKQLLDEPPVLLLDDVLSELDLDRQRFLVSEIDDVQLFITSAELNDEVIRDLRGGTLFRIEEGTVTRVDKY